MKICKLLTFFMMPIIMLNGCNLNLDNIPIFGPQHGVNAFRIPDKVFEETVLKAVSALDNNDMQSFTALFTEESRNSDKEFLDDIETLFEIYNQK